MAIFHLHCKIISRVGAHSVVAAAAYRAATVLRDERCQKTFDFQRKTGVDFSAILAPPGAPRWVEDRGTLWNKVEVAERRCDAALAREITLALPVELSDSAQEKLLVAYVTEQFVSRGMVADCNLHRDNPDNPHAHILLTTRQLTEDGFGPKVRDWNDRTLVTQWRHAWETSANHMLAREGHEARVDARSYEAQGVALEPTRKVGTVPGDIRAERQRENEAIRFKNGRIIERDPLVALRVLTHSQATFTRHQLDRFLRQRTASEAQRQACEQAILSSPALVSLPAGKGRVPRLTSREMLQVEFRLLEAAQGLSQARASSPMSHAKLAKVAGVQTLNHEQQRALANLVADTGNLALLEGYAGTGKGVTLGVARAAWESCGQRVLGAALSAKAADGLGQATGMPARTLAAWEYAWNRGRDNLQPGDVFVIDEAAMVGTRQLERVLTYAHSQGSKVVLAGDARQLQAIEAGAPFRALAERFGHVTLAGVRRQREAWQQEATVQFAEGNVLEALQAYADHGRLYEHGTREKTAAAVVAAWYRHQRSRPHESAVLLAYRRDEVEQLNRLAREALHSEALRSTAQTLHTERGPRAMVPGERVVFLRNDAGLGVRNGTLGTIEHLSDKDVQVRLEPASGRPAQRVAFSLKDYRDLDYGYATTLHKAQGLTVDRSFIWAGRNLDQQASYVAFTRHRQSLEVHYALEDFSPGEKALRRSLARARGKDLAMDHVLLREASLRQPTPQLREGQPGCARTNDLRRDLESLSFWARSKMIASAERKHQQALQQVSEAEKSATISRRSPQTILLECPEVKAARASFEKAESLLQDVRAQIAESRKKKPVRSWLGQVHISFSANGHTSQLPPQEALQRAQAIKLRAFAAYKAEIGSPQRQKEAQHQAARENRLVHQENVKSVQSRISYRHAAKHVDDLRKIEDAMRITQSPFFKSEAAPHQLKEITHEPSSRSF